MKLKFIQFVTVSAAASLGIFSSPLSAQESEVDPAPDYSGMEYDQLVAVFREDPRRWSAEPCEFGVPLLSAMEAKNPAADPVRTIHFLAQIYCSDTGKQYPQALQVFDQLEAAFPQDDYSDLGFYLLTRNDAADRALDRLKALDFESAGELSEDRFWFVVRMLSREGKNDEVSDLALEWSGNGIFGALTRGQQSGLAFRALSSAIRQDRLDEGEKLLSLITSPRSYISLLTEREYEPLWPAIERRAGPNLKTVGAEDVRLTGTRLENNEADRDRFSEAAHALHFDGRFEDAIALAQQWQKREKRGEELEEGDGWALNIQAYAYDSLGKPELADAVFDKLAELDPDENPWVVSFVINRASRLIGQGRWDEGVEAAKVARTVAEENGNTYAKAIIASNLACAYVKTGQRDKIAPEIAFLRENSEEGLVLAAKGLICVEERQEAVDLLMAAFADPTQKDTALGAFQVDELDLFYTQSMLPDASDLLPEFPELRAELTKHRRDMPESYIPQAALKRAVLELPEWE
ncbi:hypothetical protein [Erythrobacter crassostreae]|uniref:Tetratricopeptide repeat protein n=1 Tax=Erythrobacter crassostreae TaxID=2828328 RepID=A0A9X1F458_9SPHN|nr:hypothetical protein [Erythrobacter crassostrea]MBV7259153.1 hypothetical protein [Erythrobacter crassostrea]